MTKLSVNINKIATLRNARGGNMPDVIEVAKDCERFGADGITIHPRPDERHIKKSDAIALSKILKVPLNIEGYPSNHFLSLVKKIKPAWVTLVPDAPEALTSNAGWNILKHQAFLNKTIDFLKQNAIKVSVFIAPDVEMAKAAVRIDADAVELYTESYASIYNQNKEKAILPYKDSANIIANSNMELHAGHDLNLKNLQFFRESIPALTEVSIGHALISDALYFGIENTIQMYKRCL